MPATCCWQIVVLHIDNNPLSGTCLSFSPCIIVISFLLMSGMRLKFSHFRVLLFKGSFDFFCQLQTESKLPLFHFKLSLHKAFGCTFKGLEDVWKCIKTAKCKDFKRLSMLPQFSSPVWCAVLIYIFCLRAAVLLANAILAFFGIFVLCREKNWKKILDFLCRMS